MEDKYRELLKWSNPTGVEPVVEPVIKKYRPWGISPINNEGCHMPFIPLEVLPSMPAGYI